jgi:hypothetical protein
MTRGNHLEMLRRVRLVSVVKDRPVTLPYGLLMELLRTAAEGIIDDAWYQERYPDVAEAIKQGIFESASHHFASTGLQEGRMPYPAPIDERAYLVRHKDVAKAIQSGKVKSAADHFYLAGFFEGRAFQLADD